VKTYDETVGPGYLPSARIVGHSSVGARDSVVHLLTPISWC
jgi:hypothetical protein